MVKKIVKNDDYSAKNIIALDQHQQLLQNMTVTFGEMEAPDDPYCLQKDVAIREILDNGLDEIRSGHGSKLRLTFFEDASIEIQDSGRGIPVDVGSDANGNPVSGIYLAMGVMNAGRNYTNDSKRFSAGRHGVGGASTVHASRRADITVYRDGKEYSLSFKDGTPGFFTPKTISPEFLKAGTKSTIGPAFKNVPKPCLEQFTPLEDYTVLHVQPDSRGVTVRKGFETGTKIRFWLNNQTFRSEKPYDSEDLTSRLRDTAFLVPNLEATVVNHLVKVDGKPKTDKYHFSNGLTDFINLIQPDTPICEPIIINTVGSYVEKNALDRTSNSKVSYHDQKRELPISIVFRYGDKFSENGENIKSYVNTIRTKDGGEHLIGFLQGLTNAFNSKISSMRGFVKAGEELPSQDDYVEGLSAVVSVLVASPSFTSQNKNKLSGVEVRAAVRKAVEDALTVWANRQKNLNTMRAIAQKVTLAAKNRRLIAVEKAAKRKTQTSKPNSMPSKLSECEFVGQAGSELLICEGDSAKSGLMQARDARFQAIFPIRGKFINCLKAGKSKVLENKEAADIIKALGCGSELTRDFDITNMRYDRVLIATDSDVDGSAIKDLLLTFFWVGFPEIIKQGKLYDTVPPLFEISFKGRLASRETISVENDDKLPQCVKKLDAEGLKQGKDYEIHRNKGLGENNFDVTWNTMMNPKNRTLKRITIEDVKQAEEALDLAMGPSVENRKKWIEENYDKLNPDLLDI